MSFHHGKKLFNKLLKGDECFSDYDGDGVRDEEDVCPENKFIQHTDMRKLETIDLCEKEGVKSRFIVHINTFRVYLWL